MRKLQAKFFFGRITFRILATWAEGLIKSCMSHSYHTWYNTIFNFYHTEIDSLLLSGRVRMEILR